MQTKDTLSSGPDWGAVERDYRAGSQTTKELCLAHDISRWQLYETVRLSGWPFRQPTRTRQPSADLLVRRLVDALDQEMRCFEQRLKDTPDRGSSADRERDARTLGTLVRLFEKLIALQSTRAKPGKPRSSSSKPVSGTTTDTNPTEAAHDQERLRGELARRLDTLRVQIGG